jgi:hypothetical protein
MNRKGIPHMSLITEQHISAQVWTCTRCGGEDPKSCGCSAATATSREIQAAKKEANRQATKKYRAKSKAASYDATVENVGESPKARKPGTTSWLEDEDGRLRRVSRAEFEAAWPAVGRAAAEVLAEISPEEEAEKSYQETLYDKACMLLKEMTEETRQKFFASIMEKFSYFILEKYRDARPCE